MRQYISGKWLAYGGTGFGYRCYYYHKLVYNSDFKMVNNDPLQEYWTIGSDVIWDLWVSWAFADHEPDRGRVWKNNATFIVTIENINTGTKGSIIYTASSLGLTSRVGDGIIHLKFKPEDVGITTSGRYPIKLEIEAFSSYETEVIHCHSYFDSVDDYGNYMYPYSIPRETDYNLSIEKNEDRVEDDPNLFPSYAMVNHCGELTPIILTPFVTIASNIPNVDFLIENENGSPISSGVAPLHVLFTNLTQSEYDIVYCRWYFGDGMSSSDMGIDNKVPHIFALPGTYNVTLTVGNGQQTSYKTKTIVVGSATCKPEFIDGTYLPQASYPGSPVVVKFNIKNNGGAGKIYIKATGRDGTKTIASSITLAEYSPGKLITMPAYNLEWYCGYKPTAETNVSVLFEVGPEGGAVADTIQWDTFEIGSALNCPLGQVPNEAGTACVDAPITEDECASKVGWHWDEDKFACVKDTGSSKTWVWVTIGIGSALALLGGALMLRKKNR